MNSICNHIYYTVYVFVGVISNTILMHRMNNGNTKSVIHVISKSNGISTVLLDNASLYWFHSKHGKCVQLLEKLGHIDLL